MPLRAMVFKLPFQGSFANWSRTNYTLIHCQLLYQMSYSKWSSELDLNQRPPDNRLLYQTELSPHLTPLNTDTQ
jgi:hypothetical protein